MVDGIYTLANDSVYDQLVALLNSIDANAAGNFPVGVIAYDDRLEKVKAEVARRPNVTLLADAEVFQTWEDFSFQVWQTHPTALANWKAQGIQTRFYRVGENHRYGAFDPQAPFERFIYLDADTLVMGPLQPVFDRLGDRDFVVYDFQFKSPDHIFNLKSPRLTQVIEPQRLGQTIFCSGFYGAKRGLFPPQQRQWLIDQLAQGDAEVLYLGAPNQSVLNYMVHKSRLSVSNLAHDWPADRVTGNSVTSSHFQARDQVLYDKGRRLTYLHFIGISSKVFRRLCAGENLEFPYREVFLHYRYRHAPQQRPAFRGPLKPYKAPPPPLMQRVLRKLKLSS